MPAITSIEYKFRKGVGSTAVWESSWNSLSGLEPFTLYQSPAGYSGYPDKVSDIMFRINLDTDLVSYVQTLYLLSLNCQVVKWSGQGTPTDGARIDQAAYRVDPTISQNKDALPVARAIANIPVGDPANYNTQYWTWQGGSAGLSGISCFYVKLTCIASSGTMGAIAIGNESFSLANFDITYRSKAPSFNLSPSSVYSGTPISITIMGRLGRTIKIKFRYIYNNIPVTLEDVVVTEDTAEHVCPGTWFISAGQIDTSIKTASQMTVTAFADVQRDNGSWDPEVWSGTFTFKAGNDMKPVISTPVITCEQPSPASTNYPDTFFQGISKARIEFTVTSLVGSTISSVVCLCTNGETISLSYNAGLHEYTGFTSNAVTDGTLFTISAGDSRGLIASLTTDPISAIHYVPPAIEIDRNYTYRTDSSGQQDMGGSYYKAKAFAFIDTSVDGNQIVQFRVKANASQYVVNLTSGVQSINVRTTYSAAQRMVLKFTLTDYVGYSAEKTYYLDGNSIWVWLETASDGTGANIGLGKKPQDTVSGVSSIDLNVNAGSEPDRMGYLLEGMNALAFKPLLDFTSDGSSFGRNFKSVDPANLAAKENATVYFNKAANASNWTNVPTAMSSANWQGIRMVFATSSSSALVMVIEINPSLGRLWFLKKTGSLWSSWTSTAAPT